MDLSQTDYKKIIHYYQIKKQKNKTYKESAEDILANKLCKCMICLLNKQTIPSQPLGVYGG